MFDTGMSVLILLAGMNVSLNPFKRVKPSTLSASCWIWALSGESRWVTILLGFWLRVGAVCLSLFVTRGHAQPAKSVMIVTVDICYWASWAPAPFTTSLHGADFQSTCGDSCSFMSGRLKVAWSTSVPTCAVSLYFNLRIWVTIHCVFWQMVLRLYKCDWTGWI